MKQRFLCVLLSCVFCQLVQAQSDTVSQMESPQIVLDPPTVTYGVVEESVDVAGDIAGASTLVDDTTNSEGDISSGEVVGTKTVNDTAINSIKQGSKIYTTTDLSTYAKKVNEAVWVKDMKVNSAMTVKLQALLDWNHASPGPIDGGFGMNSKRPCQFSKNSRT